VTRAGTQGRSADQTQTRRQPRRRVDMIYDQS
jgi:hypothetical protein